MTCFSCLAFGGRAYARDASGSSSSSSTAKDSAAAQKGTAPPSKTTGDAPLPHASAAASLKQLMQDSIMQVHFDKFSKDGRMNRDQFKDLCKENEKAYALEELEMEAAFVKLDDDNTGYIEFAEFQRWCRLQDGRAGFLRFESAAMQWRVSDAMDAFKREVGSRMCMSEAQFANHCCNNGMHLLDAQLRTKFKSIDKDSNNNIDFSEYLRWRLKDSPFEIDHYYNQGAIDMVASFFQTYETDQTAKLTAAQFTKCHSALLRYSQGRQFSWPPPLETCIQQLDVDGDGLISRHEFLDWWFRSSPPLRQS